MTPWRFVPTLYFFQGLPYSLVTVLSVIMFKKLGVANEQIGFWSSFFVLPWVVKPLWSPAVDGRGTKRGWVTGTQLLLALLVGALAFAVNMPHYFSVSVAILFAVAFMSATHDVAADGLYILSLESKQQAFFSGIRNTCYRLSMLFGQGALVMAVGYLEFSYGTASWSLAFAGLAVLMFVMSIWHRFALPRIEADRAVVSSHGALRSFFSKPGVGVILAFLLTYRLGEAQLLKMATPFMLDSREVGGLALSTADVGFGYGVLGVGALLAGGLLGGIMVSRDGLQRWIVPMWLSLNVPNLLYVLLAYTQPLSKVYVFAAIAVEQFGYGFGFSAFMIAMLGFASEGQWKTAHYAICTGFMSLGVMLPGMPSGYLQKLWGYPLFFLWTVLCALPAWLAIRELFVPRARTVSS